jgi:hypothetical protein
MNLSPEYRWRKYKTDFLRANRCTEAEFERIYIAFQESKPNAAAYRKFARKYHITIHRDPNIPADMQVVLSVNISVIKVLAQTYAESIAAVEDISKGIPND